MLFALVGRERPEQHHAGVVDEDVRSPELVLNPLGSCEQRVAVGHVRLDRESAIAELLGQRLDPIRPAGKQRHAVAASATSARAVAAPMPEEAPVMTATRPSFLIAHGLSPVVMGIS